MAPSTATQAFGVKRKRKASTSSNETSARSDCYDPEITFKIFTCSSPAKKKPCLLPNADLLTKPCEPISQLVDEDISFRIVDTFDLVEDSKPNNGISQLIDDEITFNLDGNSHLETEVELEPRRSPNGYILPDPLPAGLIVTDLKKGRWKIGNSVGLGGFGEIYSAASWNGCQKSIQEDYVIKVEPHSNGPLFMEINFYLRAAKAEMIHDYKQQHGLEHLGVPEFIASGSFTFRGKKLRFLVMPRFGTDLQTVLDKSGNILSIATASSIALQVIDCYEYLHSKGFVHKDLKGSNLLVSRYGSSDASKVFLVDFGLVSKLTKSGLPKPNTPDPRSAHEGTLAFCSRDAHRGCISRRGDFEVLLFNLIDWLGGRLPWDEEPQLKPKIIERMKIKAFSDIPKFLHTTFKTAAYPAFLDNLMRSIDQIRFHDVPDYNFFRSIFEPMTSPAASQLPLSQSLDDEEVILSLKMEKSPTKKFDASPDSPRKRKVNKTSPNKPRRAGLRARPGQEQEMESQPEVAPEVDYDEARSLLEQEWNLESLKNPTPAMLLQLDRIKNRKVSSSASSNGSASVVTGGRRKVIARRRRRRTHGSTPIRQRRKSSESETPKQEIRSEALKVLARSPTRPAAGFARSVTIQRDVDKKSFRKRFESAVGGLGVSQFLFKVSKSFFPFQKEA